jgi:hypothetical protein
VTFTKKNVGQKRSWTRTRMAFLFSYKKPKAHEAIPSNFWSKIISICNPIPNQAV